MSKKGIHLVYHNSVSDLRSVNHWLEPITTLHCNNRQDTGSQLLSYMGTISLIDLTECLNKLELFFVLFFFFLLLQGELVTNCFKNRYTLQVRKYTVFA